MTRWYLPLSQTPAPTGVVLPSSIAAADGTSPPLSAGPLGLRVVNEDITAAVQADINAGASTIWIPEGSQTLNPITFGSLSALELRGPNRNTSTVKLGNGANAPMLVPPVGCKLTLHDLILDGNGANQAAGTDLVNMADTGTYQTSLEAHRCNFQNAQRDNIYAGVGRNAGRLIACGFGTAGRHNFNCAGADWAAIDVPFGNAGTNNIFLTGDNLKLLICDVFGAGADGVYVGFNALRLQVIGGKNNNNANNGMYFDQWAGGQQFQNIPNNHIVQGTEFDQNSTAGTGLYSDILLHGVVGILVDVDYRFESSTGTKPKYHLEDQVVNNPAGGSASRVRFNARYLSTPLGANPTVTSYSVGVTNVADILRTDFDHPEPKNPGTVALFPGNGLYYQGPINVSTSNTLGNGNLTLQPVYISQRCTLQALFAEFTAAGDAASLFALACYADNGKGYPGALVATGPTISTGTGNAGNVSTGGTPNVYSGPISGGNVILQPGLYWIGGAIQGVTVTQPTIRTGYFSAPALPYTTLPGTNTGASGVTNSAVTSALPATFSVTHSNTFNPPRVGFRIV